MLKNESVTKKLDKIISNWLSLGDNNAIIDKVNDLIKHYPGYKKYIEERLDDILKKVKENQKAANQEEKRRLLAQQTNSEPEQLPTEASGAILRQRKRHSAIKTEHRLKKQTTKRKNFKIFGMIFIFFCLIGAILKLVIDQQQSPQNHKMVPSLTELEEKVVKGIIGLRSELLSNQNNAEIISLQKCKKITRCNRLNIKHYDHQTIRLLQGHEEQECIKILKKYDDKKFTSHTGCMVLEVFSYQRILTTDMVHMFQKEEILSMGKVDSYLENIEVTPSMEIIGKGSSAKCVKKNISKIIKEKDHDLGSIHIKVCVESILAIPSKHYKLMINKCN